MVFDGDIKDAQEEYLDNKARVEKKMLSDVRDAQNLLKISTPVPSDMILATYRATSEKTKMSDNAKATFRAIAEKVYSTLMTNKEVAEAIGVPWGVSVRYIEEDGITPHFEHETTSNDEAYSVFWEIAAENNPIVQEIKATIDQIAKGRKGRIWWNEKSTAHVGRTQLGWIAFERPTAPFNDDVGQIEKSIIGSHGTCHVSAFRKLNGKFTDMGRLSTNPAFDTIEDLRDYWKTLASGNFKFPENMKKLKNDERLELDSKFVKDSLTNSVADVLKAVEDYDNWLKLAILSRAMEEVNQNYPNRLSLRLRSINPDIDYNDDVA